MKKRFDLTCIKNENDTFLFKKTDFELFANYRLAISELLLHLGMTYPELDFAKLMESQEYKDYYKINMEVHESFNKYVVKTEKSSYN